MEDCGGYELLISTFEHITKFPKFEYTLADDVFFCKNFKVQ